VARSRLHVLLDHRSDDPLLRGLFGLMLAGTVAVLALDYAELQARGSDEPALPSITAPAVPGPADEKQPPVRADEKMPSRMTFELVGDGRLLATGAIQPGTADVFAAEVAKRSSYVKTVVLHSPGGSVGDALAMGRLIRKHGFATEVERLCASSCPLVFAGGTERRAGEKAAIGVHQVFSVTASSARAGNPMESGQRVSAECQRYLHEMGVDPQVWMHAMETPKERLYYFKADELLTLKLATAHGRARSKPAATEARKS
jgi:hypothetical protein